MQTMVKLAALNRLLNGDDNGKLTQLKLFTAENKCVLICIR